ncbi:FIST N-terminal domain-containing protein [Thioflexithrix psekupsensis]|uniref:FIST domain-containing protein n=1 Tax=Thioflexithrix psekupsensis TaxID=1570016 RepID=A0A251XA56_9GAMM|nr:FIST N-terminal domain-containing protein [Thioflexithrix psekupsensis]OUD14402.1 hypothetical protein TPSD3_08820 [Thioflexithrix psekupsensis]
MLKTIIASTQLPLKEAAFEIIEKIRCELLNVSAKKPLKMTGLLFSSHLLDQAAHQVFLDNLLSEFPELQLVGCTVAADANCTNPYLSHEQITLCLFLTDNKINITAGLVSSIKGNGEEVRKSVKQSFEITQEKQEKKSRLCLLFPALFLNLSDTANTAPPMKAVFAGIAASNLYKRCKILGAIATAHDPSSEEPQPSQYHSLQFFNGQIFTEAMPYLLFSGSLHFQCTYANPVQPIEGSEKWLPVEIRDNQLLRIAHLAASDYLNKTPLHKDNKHYSLIVKKSQTPLNEPIFHQGENHYILNAVDEEDKAALKLGYSNPYKILESSRTALKDLNNFKFEPRFFLGFSDMKRANCLNVNREIGSEFDLLENQLSTLTNYPIPSLMVYGFAEIGYPFAHSKSSSLNRMVLVGLLIGEEESVTQPKVTPKYMSPEKMSEFSMMLVPVLLDLLQDKAILNELSLKERVTKVMIVRHLREKLLQSCPHVESVIPEEDVLLNQSYKFGILVKQKSSFSNTLL